ncbi:MAG: isochorismatase family protein [Bryobacteraceae bacterium]|nr:isochorismatase family protein [Bryobacteraceae bacterium]
MRRTTWSSGRGLRLRGVSLKPAETLVGSGQTFFSKVTTNAFADGAMDQLLDSLEPVERYVEYGVATDVCVDFLVKGLLRRGAGSRIVVVTDAVRALSPANAAALMADLAAAGGGTATTAEICAV